MIYLWKNFFSKCLLCAGTSKALDIGHHIRETGPGPQELVGKWEGWPRKQTTRIQFVSPLLGEAQEQEWRRSADCKLGGGCPEKLPWGSEANLRCDSSKTTGRDTPAEDPDVGRRTGMFREPEGLA